MWETNINVPRADSCFKHCESKFIASLGKITIPGEVGRDGGYLFGGGSLFGPRVEDNISQDRAREQQ